MRAVIPSRKNIYTVDEAEEEVMIRTVVMHLVSPERAKPAGQPAYQLRIELNY